MNRQKTTIVFIFINLISLVSYGLSWAELVGSSEGSSRTTRTPFIMLAARVFDETEEEAERKLSRFHSRALSNFWVSSKRSECFALFTLAQAGNFEKLQSFLASNSFKPEELSKALLYARQDVSFDCFAQMNSCGFHRSCVAFLEELLSQSER